MKVAKILSVLFILGAFCCAANAQGEHGTIGLPRRDRAKSEPANEPSNVTSLTLDKEVIYSSCAGKPAAECTDDGAKIKVATVAEDKENEILIYKYTAAAGRIIGQGASIVWDLSGVPAGKYSITAGSDDGCGVCGRTMTKEIEVKAGPEIENLVLSSETICTFCPNGRRPESDKEKMIVEVRTAAKNATDDLVYYYAVSGGEIIGSGANVKWDLRGTFPGEYKITAGLGRDNIVRGETVTRTIKHEECGCCLIPCACPVYSPISGPPGPVKPGDTIILRSNIQSEIRISLKWSVSSGTILGYPEGPSVMIKVPAETKVGDIIVTREILGADPSCSCITSDTFTIKVGTGNTLPKDPPELK